MDFLTFIQTQKRILLDGAMGTQQDRRGLKPGGQNNLTNPEVVLEIHREYARCGCHALITNTLTMNRIYIETHHIEVGVQEVNRAGTELAKQAADDHQYVLGDISSTGQLLEPHGTYKESEFYDAFKEQAGILAKAGVDGFVIETMFDLREALCALRACRDNFPLPVIVSMAFTTTAKGGRTIMGDSVEECVRRITDGGADVIGANCGDLDPFQMGDVVSVIQSATSLPILAQPNAGRPKLVNNATVYEMDPKLFAAGVAKCSQAGARVVGGCCGTSPEHIRAVASLFDDK